MEHYAQHVMQHAKYAKMERQPTVCYETRGTISWSELARLRVMTDTTKMTIVGCVLHDIIIVQSAPMAPIPHAQNVAQVDF